MATPLTTNKPKSQLEAAAEIEKLNKKLEEKKEELRVTKLNLDALTRRADFFVNQIIALQEKLGAYSRILDGIRSLLSRFNSEASTRFQKEIADQLRAALNSENPDDRLLHLCEQLREVGAPSEQTTPKSGAPLTAPALFQASCGMRPSEFLQAHWRPLIESGAVCRPDVRRLDPALKTALDDEFRGRPDEYAKALPRLVDRRRAKVRAALGDDLTPEQTRRGLRSLSRAESGQKRFNLG